MRYGPILVTGMHALAAIVETGSFVRASELLDVSPSGVSRAMARLERHLGVRLMRRTTRAVSLTDEGRQFYQRVAPLLQEIQEAADSARDAAGRVHGRLRLQVDPMCARMVLDRHLGAFAQRYPEVLIEVLAREHLGDLAAEGCDLALRFGTPQSPLLVGRRLLQTATLTVAAPAYLARRGLPPEPAAIARDGHACLHYRDPQTGRPQDWRCRVAGQWQTLATQGPIMVNDAGLLLGLCLAGQGLAQLPRLGIAHLLASGALVQVLPDCAQAPCPLYALYPSRRLLPARMRALLDFVAGLQDGADAGPA